MVETDNYDEYVKLKHENEKLKKDLEKLSTTNTIVIENLNHDCDVALENEKLKEENKKLKERKIMMLSKGREQEAQVRERASSK